MEAIREILAGLCALFYQNSGEAGTVLYNLGVIKSLPDWSEETDDVKNYARRVLKNVGDAQLRQKFHVLIDHFRLQDQLGVVEQMTWQDGESYRRAMLQLSARASALDTQGWLVFASLAKPRPYVNFASTTLVDATDSCLIIQSPLPLEGVTVAFLKEWWSGKVSGSGMLVARMRRAIEVSSKSEAELRVYDYFYKTFYQLTKERFANDCIPALLPQVWLNYDPLTREQRAAGTYVDSQRVDFAFVLPGRRWAVMEIDGDSHFSDGGTPSRANYQRTIRATRNFQIDGIECYRFGNDEVLAGDGEDLLHQFWNKLFE